MCSVVQAILLPRVLPRAAVLPAAVPLQDLQAERAQTREQGNFNLSHDHEQ